MKLNLHFESQSLETLLDQFTLIEFETTLNKYLSEYKPHLSRVTTNAILEIYFITDLQIKGINSARRGKDMVTDVLSWEMYETDIQDNKIFGEIYLSDDYVVAKANKKSKDLRQEVLFLITHGFLHICGYTHENDTEEELMNKETDYILKKLDIDYDEDII